MTLILELAPEREAILREIAAARGKEANGYVLDLIDEAIAAQAAPKRPFYETATPEEWVKAWHEWTHSHDLNTPVLLDDSREVIYED